ncbi:MAG: hypothetical protein J6M60_07485 [Clostridia bacterium]|nr:hypothetical protein [Clostridia bacterium]
MKHKLALISIYSVCHFVVDFVCAIFMLGNIPFIAQSESEFVISLIIYNFFAFAFQVPLGLVLDKLKIYKYVAIIGLSLIGICYLININNPYILAIIVGIGNALFHLEGGVNIYSVSERKAFLNGLFVAPGALGIFLGTTFHNELIITYLPIILIFTSIFLLFFVQKKEEVILNLEKNMKINMKNDISKLSAFLIVALIGVSIIVRSIGGSAIVYTWKEGFILGLIYTLAVVIGKAFGGLIADKFGFIKVALISLLGSTVCLILGYNIHFFAYIGILLFNIPMSITLTLLENTLTKKIACAVGLNTFFLFIGYLVCFIDITINNNFILLGSILVAMLSIYLSYKLYLKGGNKYVEKI